MNFNDAYNAMKKGKKVKCKNNIISFGNDRLILENVNNTLEDINKDMVTLLEDVFSNDWEVVEEPKSKVWKPSLGDLYYYINSNGDIKLSYYNTRSIDKRCIGNFFKTDEEAEHMVEKLKIIKELRDFALEHNDEEIDWHDKEQDKFEISYEDSNDGVKPAYNIYYRSQAFNIYFTSLEIAKEAIKTVGEDRIKKYYFDIDD